MTGRKGLEPAGILLQVFEQLGSTVAPLRELCAEVADKAKLRGDKTNQVRAEQILAVCDERAGSVVGSLSLAPSVSEMWLGGRVSTRGSTGDPRGADIPPPFHIDESPDFLTLFEERSLGFY